MKKDSNKNNNPEKDPKEATGRIVISPIAEEMKKAYINYAMSVITDRALPDVRDGLKPVHRRILFSMYKVGLSSTSRFKKSATVVGDVIGNYHPHGDSSVYEAMVKMAQPFSMRYPLVLGQGNFGSIDGDKAAAYRYTESKMSKLAEDLLKDLEKDTVNFRLTFDSTKREPIVLPAGAPNLLLNGTLGIAVGMATDIPPHNIGEVIDATFHLIDNPKATTEDLLNFVKGPDFPGGGIAFNQKDISVAYANGRGGVVCRGEAEIIEQSNGGHQIIITSIPYRVNKATLIEKIASLIKDKRIEGIKGLRDESAEDIRVVVDVKATAHPQNILNSIYKHTQLEDAFHYNMVALVDGVPQTLSLKSILEEFIKHRVEVIVRRANFELKKAQDREHILLGLKKALDHIDEIIKLIKASKDAQDAHVNLMKKFKFSDRQATAILEMRLQKLAGLERKKIEDELKAIQILIKYLLELLKSKAKQLTLIKQELKDVRDKYADERRTKIIKHGVKNISVEDLVPDEESILVLTSGGYVKRTNPNEFKAQKRGGVGVIDMDTKEEDFVRIFLKANTHSDLLFFTDKGKAYQIKMYEIAEGKKTTRGKSIMNYLPLESDELVTSVLPMPKTTKKGDFSVMMTTSLGVAKKVDASNFHDVRRNGIISIKLHEGDSLVSASFVGEKDEISLITRDGQSIRFKSNDIREMGRSAAGVKAIKMKKDDIVVSGMTVRAEDKDASILVVSENGYGKQTKIKEYKVQKRGGSGIKTAKVTTKNGPIIGASIVNEEISEIVAMSKKGQVIRIKVEEVPDLGRQTQGVRIMKMKAGDKIASLVCL